MKPKRVFEVANLSVYAGPWEGWKTAWDQWSGGVPGYFLALAVDHFFGPDARPKDRVWVVGDGIWERIPPGWTRAHRLPPGTPFNGPQDAEGMVIEWPDMTIPSFLHPEDWRVMADILLGLSGNLFVGCGAGKGRTGTTLAILAGLWGITETPIEYVRRHYRQEAVETGDQVAYVARITGLKEDVRGSCE